MNMFGVLSRAIIVNGVQPADTKADVESFFAGFSEVEAVIFRLDPDTGSALGSAFVVFKSASASSIFSQANQHDLGSWDLDELSTTEWKELSVRLQDLEVEESVLRAFKMLSPGGRQQLRHTLAQSDSVGAQASAYPPAPLVGPEAAVPPDKTDQLSRVLFTTPVTPARSQSRSTSLVQTSLLREVPKLPIFTGEKGKDSTFGRWSYEVRCLQQGPYDDFMVLTSIRHSLKSPAAELLVRMGQAVSVDDILKRFESRYGIVLAGEAIVEKLYALSQGDLSVSSWAFQLEDLAYQAEEKGTLLHSAIPKLLKSRFWRGLQNKQIQEATRHTWESFSFDELVTECRALDEEYASDVVVPKAKAKVQQAVASEPDTLQAVLDKLNEVSARLEKMERKEKATESKKGKETESKEKKIISCNRCKKTGHFYWGCRQDEVCTRCTQKGHIAKACRNPPKNE